MPSSEDGARKSVSFTAVLKELCLYSKDVLVDALQSAECLKPARLASQALREAVDDSLRNLRVFLNPDDAQRVAAGQWFPLRRWPRLLRVTISPCNVASDADFIEQLALPFTGQPLENLQRMKRITVVCYRFGATVEAAVALSALLYRMPGLRYVNMGVCLSKQLLQQLLLFDALASLTQLEELHLQYSFATSQQMGALASHLKALTISAENGMATVAELCAVVAQMPALEVTDLVLWDLGDGDVPALAQLLSCPSAPGAASDSGGRRF